MPEPMRRFSSLLLAAMLVSCGGGGDGPVTVGAVAIATAAPATFATLGRTVQLSAQATDGAGAVISGAAISWTSSNPGAVTVNSSGLASAAGNGSAQVRAQAGGVQSAPVTVTVQQVVDHIAVTPAVVAFGAIGSSRQLSASAVDSGGSAVGGFILPAFTRSGNGATASVTVGGLVTALAAGASDTAVIGSTRVPISVTPVVVTVIVTSTVTTPDTLFTTGRTRQFTGVSRDSNNNAVAATLAWTTTAPSVATVDAAGLVSAVGDGVATIQASVPGKSGTRPMIVRRLAANHSISPVSANIAVSGGTQPFTGSATDSLGAPMTLSWVSRNTSIVTVSPATGSSTTATAAANGSTRVVLSVPSGPVDSATVSNTNQPAGPATAAVQVGDNFYRSVRNLTVNMAIDTVGVNGTVTWTWVAGSTGVHNVETGGDPRFPGGANQTSGTFAFTFTTAGTYAYTCMQHPAMTGTVVVR